MDKSRERGNGIKVLTHLITLGRKHYAVLIFYRQPQLKGVD